MSRAGRIPRHGYDEGDGIQPRHGDERGRAVGGPSFTWAGVGLAALVVVGLALLGHQEGSEAEDEPTEARFRRTASPLGAVAFAPDGRSLALEHSDGALEIRDLSRGRPRMIEARPTPGATGRGLAYSPDGRTLASGGRGPVVNLWDVRSGEPRGSLEGHSATIGSLAFSPDGNGLASGSLDGAVKLWDVKSGRERVPVAGHSQEVRGLAFSPDGKSLAVGLGAASDGSQGRVILWNLSEGLRSIRVLGLASFASVAFSPDGRTLAAAGGDRVVKLWDVDSGQELPNLAGHEGIIASLSFSPDGRFLATAGQDSLFGLFHFEGTRHHL